MKQYIVTLPATALDTAEDVQVLVREYEGGMIEADVRTPARQSIVWTPVGIVGGSVVRA